MGPLRPTSARAVSKIAEDDARRELSLVRGQIGDEIDCASHHVATVQRSLRTAKNLRAFQVQEVTEHAGGAREIDTIEVHRRARIGPGKDRIGPDPADGELGKAGVLGERHRGHQAGKIGDAVRLAPLQLFTGQHADGRRYFLKLAFSGLVRGDEDFFEDPNRQGHADDCGLAVDDSNDTSAGCETFERRGDDPVAARHGFENEASLVIRSCLQRRHPG